jgi:hypothetical protein
VTNHQKVAPPTRNKFSEQPPTIDISIGDIQKSLHFHQCVLVVVKLENVPAPVLARKELVVALVKPRFASVVLDANALAVRANARMLQRDVAALKVSALRLLVFLVVLALVVRAVDAKVAVNAVLVVPVLVATKPNPS